MSDIVRQALIQFTADELSHIQQDLTELRALDATALKPMFEKEVLIYSIMLMRYSQRNADRLAMAPKDSAAMVKSMTEATSKGEPGDAQAASFTSEEGGSRDRTKSPVAVSRKREFLRIWAETFAEMACEFANLGVQRPAPNCKSPPTAGFSAL